jgi:hypothetical protein
MAERYKIVRIYTNDGRRVVIKRNLAPEDALRHCEDPETCSGTCRGREGRRRTRRYGPWFEAYERQ